MNLAAVFISTNATDWVAKTSGTAENLNSIVCGSDGCVVGGNSGTILFSVNGTSWSTSSSGTINDILSVAYNAVFIAVAKGGVIQYSATGAGSWSSATFPTTSYSTANNLYCVISD